MAHPPISPPSCLIRSQQDLDLLSPLHWLPVSHLTNHALTFGSSLKLPEGESYATLSLGFPRLCGSVLEAGTIFRVATMNCGDPEGQEMENKAPQVVGEAWSRPVLDLPEFLPALRPPMLCLTTHAVN